MSNFGFISKRRLARELAKFYDDNSGERNSGVDQFYFECGCCNAVNYLCYKFGIKPMHRNKLGGGTGEMLKSEEDKQT